MKKIINIDGKTMRGNTSKHQKGNHILSAWSKEDGVCFGQVTVDDKSNEITAIPLLSNRRYFLVRDKSKVGNIKSIGMVEKIIKKDDEMRVERHYYISSLQTDATLFAKTVRGHWDIEVMHWHLDVLFKEDSHKVLNKTAAMNLNVLRKIALAILKKWTPNTHKKVTSTRLKRNVLSMALPKFLPSVLSI